MDQTKVSKLRKRIGWSQPEMARALGLAHAHTISHWENGFRIPKGVSERFLSLLDDLQNDDLRKITKRLEKLGTPESMEKPRARK